jgi:hypothetical protein
MNIRACANNPPSPTTAIQIRHLALGVHGRAAIERAVRERYALPSHCRRTKMRGTLTAGGVPFFLPAERPGEACAHFCVISFPMFFSETAPMGPQPNAKENRSFAPGWTLDGLTSRRLFRRLALSLAQLTQLPGRLLFGHLI